MNFVESLVATFSAGECSRCHAFFNFDDPKFIVYVGGGCHAWCTHCVTSVVIFKEKEIKP